MKRNHALLVALALVGCTSASDDTQGDDVDNSPGIDGEEGVDGWSQPPPEESGGHDYEIGDVIATYCEIDAYENGPDIWAYQDSGPYGFEWQCTEFAIRFVCEAFDLCNDKGGKHGNAWEWWDNPYNNPNLALLTKYPNGGEMPPRPGDVLVFDKSGSNVGHVAIVREVNATDGWLRVIQQNCHKCLDKHYLYSSGNKYSVTGARGWLRAPGDLPCEGGDDTGTDDDADNDGYTILVDCDDDNASIHPGATETCNSKDDDCDGSVDENNVCGSPTTDGDGDGYELSVDCDDGNASIHPGATEACNGKDDDCDGSVDEGLTTKDWYRDNDGDGYGDPDPAQKKSACAQPPGYVPDKTDCDDANKSKYPGATELADYADNDCDASVDETWRKQIYRQSEPGRLRHKFTFSEVVSGWTHDDRVYKIYDLSVGGGASTVIVGSHTMGLLRECHNAFNDLRIYVMVDSDENITYSASGSGWTCQNFAYVNSSGTVAGTSGVLAIRRHEFMAAPDVMYSDVKDEAAGLGYADVGVAWWAWDTK